MEAFLENVVENVNTTAMVVGYPVIAVIVILILWFGTRLFRDIGKIFSEMRYERWKRKNAERDWEIIDGSWELEPYEPEESSAPYNPHDTDVFPAIPPQRHDTAELPTQLFNYQEDRT